MRGDEQVQRAVRPTVGDLHGQSLLAARQRAEVGHRPVETDQPQQAFDEACRLTERHAEQNPHHQAGLDGGVAVALLAATPACRCGVPGHPGVKPDRQRAAALERFVTGRPVPGLVARGCGSAHASQLPRWSHETKPLQDVCSRAGPSYQTLVPDFHVGQAKSEGFDVSDYFCQTSCDLSAKITGCRSIAIS